MKGGRMVLSERLKTARKLNNLTQEGLAKKVSTTKGTISNYENEHSSPSNEMLNDLADALDVSTDYLLGRTNNPSRGNQQNKETKKDFTFDSLAEITKIVKNLGLEQFGFFDIEKWKNLSPDDVDEIRRHFEWVAQKAKERNEEK
jgi:HTH-type transcriptional regulator, competence development regulator